MTSLVPLILLWMWSNRSPSSLQASMMPRSAAPPWPTPKSPPPMPAFQGKPTPSPSADPGHSSTPLADLHKRPPKLAPASAHEPATVKERERAAATTPDTLKQKAISAFKQKATQQLKTRLANNAATQAATRGIAPSSLLSAALTSNSATSVPVSDLQKILTQRGIKLKRDGLYGPKTAAAWTKLAKSKSLPSTISRVGPKTAKVVTRTYDSLSTPSIP